MAILSEAIQMIYCKVFESVFEVERRTMLMFQPNALRSEVQEVDGKG